MKYRNYFREDRFPEVAETARDLIDLVIGDLELMFDTHPSAYVYDLRKTIEAILAYTDGSLEGKRILDLGCGTRPQIDICCGYGVHEPWLCRTLSLLNAHPIGIDIGNLEDEDFEGHQVDLKQENSLSFIPDNSIDVIHGCKVTVSMAFTNKDDPNEIHRYYEGLIPQVERVGKRESVLILYDYVSESLQERFMREWAKEGYAPPAP
jgi:hypothetical protein